MKFSIITAIYNCENYLSQSIESVINQDIGFKDNVQLILVDDGSMDKSKDIALKYNTSAEKIGELNDISGEALTKDTMLLIPCM